MDMDKQRMFSLPSIAFDASAKRFVQNSDDGRTCSPEAYTERSLFTQAPSYYDRYLLRAASHIHKFSSPSAEIMKEVASTHVADKRRTKKHIDSAIDYVHAGAGNVDTLHGDIYRALMRQPVTVKQGKANTAAAQLFEAARLNPEWSDLLNRVNSDPAIALSTAAMLLQNLANNSSVQKEFADDFKQQEQNGGGESKQKQETPQEGDSDEDGNTSPGDDENTPQGDPSESEDGSGESTPGEGEAGEDTLDNNPSDGGNSGTGESKGEEQQSPGKPTPSPRMERAVKTAIQNCIKELPRPDENEGESGYELAASIAAGSQAGIHADSISQIDSVLKLAEEITRTGSLRGVDRAGIEKIYQLLGRSENVMGTALTKSRHGDGEVMDVTLSGDMTRSLANEYAALACPGLDTLYYMKLAEEQVASLERRGVDDAGQGPAIVMVDISGSTEVETAFGGEEVHLYSMLLAFAVTFVKYARKWNRAVAIVPFDTRCWWTHTFVFDPMKPERVSLIQKRLERCLSITSNGGTDFIATLQELAKRMPTLFSGATDHADIIFFTDGEGNVGEHMKTKIRSVRELLNEARIFALIISDSPTKENLRRLEHTNSFLFDVVVACDPSTVSDGMDRLFRLIVEKSFYGIETD